MQNLAMVTPWLAASDSQDVKNFFFLLNVTLIYKMVTLFADYECYLFSLIVPHITGYRPILPESWV